MIIAKILAAFGKNAYLCKRLTKTTRIMATPIRIIPTLQGEDAERFLKRAEWVEAHPGTGKDKFTKSDIRRLREYLREQNLA